MHGMRPTLQGRPMRHLLLTVPLALTLGPAGLAAAQADGHDWQGGSTQTYSDPADWDEATAPGPGDYIEFGVDVTPTSFTTIISPGSQASIAQLGGGGDFAWNSPTVGGAGDLTINDTFDDGLTGLVLKANTGLTITGPAVTANFVDVGNDLFDPSRNYDEAGRLTVAGGGSLNVIGGGAEDFPGNLVISSGSDPITFDTLRSNATVTGAGSGLTTAGSVIAAFDADFNVLDQATATIAGDLELGSGSNAIVDNASATVTGAVVLREFEFVMSVIVRNGGSLTATDFNYPETDSVQGNNLQVTGGSTLTTTGFFTGEEEFDVTLTDSTWNANVINLAGGSSLISTNSTLNANSISVTGSSDVLIDGGSVTVTDGIFVDDGVVPQFPSTLEIINGGSLIVGQDFDIVGRLDLDGGSVTAGTVTIDTNATLAGDGTINGDAVVNGTLTPGQSAGLIDIDGSLSLGQNSQFKVELTGTAPEDYDRLEVAADATLNGMLAVNITGLPDAPGQTFTIIDVAGISSGAFIGLAEGDIVVDRTEFDLLITYAGGVNGNDVVLYSVPEPASAAVLAAAGLLLIRRRSAGGWGRTR